MTVFALIAWLLALGSPGGDIPAPTATVVADAVVQDLSYHEPLIFIDLQGTTYTPFVASLVQRRVLRIAQVFSPAHVALAPTAYGRKVISDDGWVLDDGDLMIQTGRVVAVADSDRVTQSDTTASVAYRWRFEASDAYRRLLALVPSRAWPRALGGACVDARERPTTSFERRITMYYANGTWSFYPQTGGTIGGCLSNARGDERSTIARGALETGASAAIDGYLANEKTDALALLEGQRRDRLTDTLEAYGVMRARFSYPTCFGVKTRFDMTERGTMLGAKHGWLVAGWGLFIPLGYYEEVLGTRRVDRTKGADPAVRFVYRFVPNANARLFPWLAPSRSPRTKVLFFRDDAASISRQTYHVATIC